MNEEKKEERTGLVIERDKEIIIDGDITSSEWKKLNLPTTLNKTITVNGSFTLDDDIFIPFETWTISTTTLSMRPELTLWQRMNARLRKILFKR